MRLAALRNAGHAGGRALLDHVELDSVSSHSVWRWEKILAAAMIVSMRRWLEEMYARTVCLHKHLASEKLIVEPDIKFTYEILRVRCDATNTPACQSSKAHVMETCSAFGPAGIYDCTGYEGHLQRSDVCKVAGGKAAATSTSRWLYPDLYRIPDTGFGGKELRQAMLQQIKSTGARAWNEPAHEGLHGQHRKHVRILLAASDQGPDQAKCHQLLQHETDDNEYMLYFRQWCYRHVAALIVKRKLASIHKMLPDVKYWASIAKIINSWRSSGKSRRFKEEWRSMFGSDAAKRATKRLPPRPLRGRWGSKQESETHLLRCGRQELTAVFAKVFPRSCNPDHDAEADVADRAIEDGLDDQEQDYSKKMGRWQREAALALADADFWFMMFSSNSIGSAINMFENFLMKPLDKMDHTLDAMQCGGRLDEAPLFVQLVAFKSAKVLEKLEMLLQDGAVSNHRLPGFQEILGTEDESTALPLPWPARIVFLALQVACDYIFRVDYQLSDWPSILIWFVVSPPDEFCQRRKDISEVLLEWVAAGTAAADTIAKSMDKCCTLFKQ